MQALNVTWRRLAANIQTSPRMMKFRHIMKAVFSEKYLYCTNVTISVTLSALGDYIEQRYEIYKNELDAYDKRRAIHMACTGAALGTICHHWYKFLDKFIVKRTLQNVTKKLILDQFMFSPIMIVTFFGTIALFENNPFENFREEVSAKFWTLYRAEWVVWPPAQIVNFYFLPTKYRVLYDNTISLGYDIYTSQVKHRKQ